MNLTNDNNCSWINDLDHRTNIKNLSTNLDSEYIIIGACFT